MTDPPAIIAFVTARYDEIEAAAEAAGGRRWLWHEKLPRQILARIGDVGMLRIDLPGEQLRQHITLNDPAYVLDDLAAKRKILELHAPEEQWAGHAHIPAGEPGSRRVIAAYCGRCRDGGCGDDYDMVCGRTVYPCPEVRALAAPFRSHPDFGPAWSTDAAGDQLS